MKIRQQHWKCQLYNDNKNNWIPKKKLIDIFIYKFYERKSIDQNQFLFVFLSIVCLCMAYYIQKKWLMIIIIIIFSFCFLSLFVHFFSLFIDHQNTHTHTHTHIQQQQQQQQILGSQREYHFQHRALPHARNKRSIGHYRKLRSDHLVSCLLFFFVLFSNELKWSSWPLSFTW